VGARQQKKLGQIFIKVPPLFGLVPLSDGRKVITEKNEAEKEEVPAKGMAKTG